MRTLLGWLRIAAWLAVLHLVTSPWRGLGGLVDERIRWVAWVAAPVGMALGVTAATGRAGVRLLLYPPGVAGAVALLALRAAGERDAAGVILVLLTGYAAGVDLGAAGSSAGGVPPKPPNRRI